MSRFMPPTDPPPRPVRPAFRIFIATLNPLPTSPSTFAAGTRTSSSTTVVVEEARIPILSSCGPVETPFMSRVTMNAVMWPRPSSEVFMNTVKKSAIPPFVIQSFSPFRTHSSPSRTAVVLMLAASEPALLGEAEPAIVSPLASFWRKRARWSSVPKRSSPRMPIELCAPTVTATDAS